MTRLADGICHSGSAASSWAENIVAKWNPDHSPYASVPCIFHESRDEARRFLSAVRELQVLAASERAGASTVIEGAMRRLQREMYQVLHSTTSDIYGALSESGDYSSDAVDRDSSSEDDDFCPVISVYGDSNRKPKAAAMSYIRSVADCMISTGYVRHCAAVYVAGRRAAVEDALCRLGFDPNAKVTIGRHAALPLLDAWLAASRAAVRVVFARERVLCDTIFGSDAFVAESYFAEVVRDAATAVLVLFPHALIGKKAKARVGTRSAAHEDIERVLLGLLEVHGTLRELTPNLETMFSSEATAELLEQTCTSTQKVEKAVRHLLAELELSMRKEGQGKKSSTSLPPTAGGLHPLALRVMSLLSSLANPATSLLHILSKNEPTRGSSRLHPRSPTSTSSSPCRQPLRVAPDRPPVQTRRQGRALSRPIRLLPLPCKQPPLHNIPGPSQQNAPRPPRNRVGRRARAEGTAVHCEPPPPRMGQGHGCAPSRPSGEAAQMETPSGIEAVAGRVRKFNVAFDAACVSLTRCVVPDDTARDELHRWAVDGVVGPYRGIYGLCRRALSGHEGVVRFAPEDVMARLGGLYTGTGSSSSGRSSSGSSSSSASGSGSGSSKGNRWRWGGRGA